jgi:hypothetical protein
MEFILDFIVFGFGIWVWLIVVGFILTIFGSAVALVVSLITNLLGD